jgi:hypothetical protein
VSLVRADLALCRLRCTESCICVILPRQRNTVLVGLHMSGNAVELDARGDTITAHPGYPLPNAMKPSAHLGTSRASSSPGDRVGAVRYSHSLSPNRNCWVCGDWRPVTVAAQLRVPWNTGSGDVALLYSFDSFDSHIAVAVMEVATASSSSESDAESAGASATSSAASPALRECCLALRPLRSVSRVWMHHSSLRPPQPHRRRHRRGIGSTSAGRASSRLM